MTLSTELCRNLGALLTQYLDGFRTFEELEASFATVVCATEGDHELLKRLYHIVNHFEIDEHLRVQDSSYEAFTVKKLRAIAASLCEASAQQVEQSINAFWNISSC